MTTTSLGIQRMCVFEMLPGADKCVYGKMLLWKKVTPPRCYNTALQHSGVVYVISLCERYSRSLIEVHRGNSVWYIIHIP